MKKNTEVKFDKNQITVLFNNVIKDQIVTLEFKPLNKYQLICSNISISNKSKSLHINSTDLRKINIHTLTKRCINLINSYINLDKETALKSMDFVYSTDIEYQEILKDVHKTALNSNRNIFLAKFSYVYIKTCLSYETNVSVSYTHLTLPTKRNV